jgi:hypothetical protein
MWWGDYFHSATPHRSLGATWTIFALAHNGVSRFYPGGFDTAKGRITPQVILQLNAV